MEDPEFDLIRAIAHGDEAAFEQAVRRYQTSVTTFICRYIRDFYCAQDLAQEVFLRIFQAAPKFTPKAKVSNWVFRIAYNLSTNEMKHRKRIHGYHAEISAEGWGLRGGPSASLTKAGNRELEERLMAALGRLPENQWAALLLKISQGLTYLEISNVMGVSVASVESLLFRARSRLKQLVRASPGINPE